MLAESNFLVSPDTGLLIWTIVALIYGPLVISAGVVTALKGRWLWLAIGLLTVGLVFIYSAFLPAAPDSEWARRRDRRASRRTST